MTWLRSQIRLVRVYAYPADYRHLLTVPANPELGVTTTDAGGEW
jgi:hypothetical protein